MCEFCTLFLRGGQNDLGRAVLLWSEAFSQVLQFLNWSLQGWQAQLSLSAQRWSWISSMELSGGNSGLLLCVEKRNLVQPCWWSQGLQKEEFEPYREAAEEWQWQGFNWAGSWECQRYFRLWRARTALMLCLYSIWTLIRPWSWLSSLRRALT